MAVEYLKPTTSAGGAWSDPAYAYDGTDTSDNSTYASETAGDSVVIWSGVPDTTLTSITDVTLKVTYECTGTGSNDDFILDYSLDGGSTWETPIVDDQPFAPHSKTTSSDVLSTSQNIPNIQVRANFNKDAGADSGLEARIWDVRVEVTGTAGGVTEYGQASFELDTTQSATASKVINADASFSTDSSLSAEASKIVLADASFTLDTTLALNQSILYTMGVYRGDESAEASFDMDVSLAADGTVTSGSVTEYGQASFSMDTTLAVDALCIRNANMSFEADTTLEVSGERDREGSSSLTTEVTLDAEGERDRESGASLTADVSLEADGTVTGVGDKWGEASLEADVSLSSASSVLRLATTSLALTASLAASGEVVRNADTSLSVDASLSALGEVVRNVDVSFSMDTALTCAVYTWGEASFSIDSSMSARSYGSTIYDMSEFTYDGQVSLSTGVTLTATSFLNPVSGEASLGIDTSLSARSYHTTIYDMSEFIVSGGEVNLSVGVSMEASITRILYGESSLATDCSLTAEAFITTNKGDVLTGQDIILYDEVDMVLEEYSNNIYLLEEEDIKIIEKGVS